MGAPHVFIPLRHQSAPNVPPPCRVTDTRRNFAGSSEAGYVKGDDDGGLDAGPCLESSDPQANALNREMAKASIYQERLNAVEEALRQHEQNYYAAQTKQQRWQGQERWMGRENEEMRLVRILHPHSFIAKLRQAGVDARLEAPALHAPSDARLWLNDFVRVGRVGLNAWLPNAQLGRKVVTTVTTLQYPYGPEYTIMRFDDYDVPTNEKYRGWRTTLIQLIVAEVITEREAERAFGPALGAAGEFYREQLYKHRALAYGMVPSLI